VAANPDPVPINTLSVAVVIEFPAESPAIVLFVPVFKLSFPFILVFPFTSNVTVGEVIFTPSLEVEAVQTKAVPPAKADPLLN
jgi:hypothetical protein